MTINEPNKLYYPFQDGTYSVAAGLKPLDTQIHGIIEIDQEIQRYLVNKQNCRAENINKYHLKHQVKPETYKIVCAYMLQQLLHHYGHYFQLFSENGLQTLRCHITQTAITFNQDYELIDTNASYLSLFDALCMQIPEDVAVFQLENETDYLSMIHLCSPNYWSPAEKIGQHFATVHEPVPGMAQMLRHYKPMLEAIVKKGSFQRFAWGVATDTQLNHHPTPPPNISLDTWHGRSFDEQNPELYVRVERQTLTGFQVENAILFTIRTYFLDVKKLEKTLVLALYKAIKGMSEESQTYKGVKEKKDKILNWLQQLAER